MIFSRFFAASRKKIGSDVFLLMEGVTGRNSAIHRCQRTFHLGKENGEERKSARAI